MIPRIKGANLVAAGILLSRIAGLLREQAIAVVLGNGAATDAFRFAMRVPNFLQNLLGEGSLSASFVPVYAGLLEKGKTKEANALASAVVSLLAIATTTIVLVLVALAGPIVTIFSNFQGEKYDLAVTLTRISTFGIGFLVIAAWCLGVLNGNRSFFLSYASPVIWNIAQIAILVVAGLAGWAKFDSALALSIAMVVGSVAQLTIQLPLVLKLVPELRLTLEQTPQLRDVVRRFTPAVGARGVIQVSSLLDTALASKFLFTGGLASYLYGQTVFLLPISLFGFSVAVSELTEMSRKSDSLPEVSKRVRNALRRVLLPAGFVTAAYLSSSRPIIDALFGWPSRLFEIGSFNDSDVTVVALVVATLGLGLPAAISARIVQNALYALGDVRGPAKVAVIRLVVGTLIGFSVMLQLDLLTVDGRSIAGIENLPEASVYGDLSIFGGPLREDGLKHLGAVGLAFGAAAAAWCEFVLLRVLLARKLGERVVTGWFWPVLLASLAAGLTMYVVGRLIAISPLDVFAVVTSGAFVYAGVLWVLGIRPTGKVGFRS